MAVPKGRQGLSLRGPRGLRAEAKRSAPVLGRSGLTADRL